MTKLSQVQNKTIEEFWINIDDYRKQLKFREWELLNPHQEHEQVGSRGSKISDTTGNRAILLAEDERYQHLKKVIAAIESILTSLEGDLKEFVNMKYISKESSYLDWDDIAYEIGVSKAKAYKLRNKLIDMTAEKLGWM